MTGVIKPVQGQKKYIKILLLVTAVFAFGILGVHIWFVNNARGVLKQIVANKSHGKLKLELSQLTFNFFSNNIKVGEAELSSTDSISNPSTYHVTFRKLTLRVRSFWPLLLQKRLLLDTIKLYDPVIEMTQWRKDTSSLFAKDDLSVPQEMGKLYNSMLDVLETFGIRRIIINNARLRLLNKMKPGKEPVSISNIYLSLVRTAGNVSKRDEFIHNEQSVDLTTTDQDIAMPGGRHRLTFKTFALHLFQKRIELDSCTVTAIATDSAKSSYKIFFKKLLLIGVDFAAMYSRNIIRADSVYCENPIFAIRLEQAAPLAEKKQRPDLQKIIRELTGDLDLGFVGVKDAGIHIEITGKKNRSLFNSNKDNFEMRGLRINSDSASPVSVTRFDMLVRDYRLYNEDSSTTYGFDSIRFVNNKIVLNNFTISTFSGGNKLRIENDVRIPYFELFGMDWYQLVFEENLKAREAILFNPVIHYKKNIPVVKKKKINFFTTLQSLDNLVTLDKINVINGQINMQLGNVSSFNLQNANISLYSNQLLQSKNKEGLRRAIERFSFSTGFIKLKDVSAHLQNVRYTGNNLVHADNISLSSRRNTIKASLDDVVIDNLLLDDNAENIVVDGLRWRKGSVSLHSPAGGKNNSNQNLILKNIAINDTKIDYSAGAMQFRAFISSFAASSIVKKGKIPLATDNVSILGNDLYLNNGPLEIKGDIFSLADDTASRVSGLQVSSIKERDSISANAPLITFSANLNDLLDGNINLSNVKAQTPFIRVDKWSTERQVANSNKNISIDHLDATEPDIRIALHKNDSLTLVSIPPSQGSRLNASGIIIKPEAISIKSFSLITDAATIVKPGGEVLGVEKGKVNLELSDISLNRNAGKSSWSALINELHLQNPNSMAIGRSKSRIMLAEGSIGNLQISSSYKENFEQMVKDNISAWLRTATGQYTDSNVTLKWYNAEYNSLKKTLGLDSFSYRPSRPLDSVIANTPYQTDYITFNSGAVKLSGFNLENYKRDGGIIASDIDVDKPFITIYRDRLPPFQHGKIKPLPVEMIRRIPFPVAVQRVGVNGGYLTYTERNEKTRAEGTIVLSKINGGLFNIRNHDISDNDSLLLALNGYFMDSALINLRVKESYADTLNGFLMTMKVKPTSLNFLNPVLQPLANVKIESGSIDSFHMRAVGKEYLAIGNMKMYYHDLRIKIVKGDSGRSTFLTRAASFLVNAFVIRKNNKGKTGLVYFKRLRDRSFFNYIVKMSFSGIATSVGIVKNKKYMKRYLRELNDKQLPPEDFE